MKNIYFALTIIGMCAITTPVFAETQSTTTPRRNEAKIQEVCTKIQNRVDDRVSNYNAYSANVDSQLEKLETRLKEVSAKLKTNGADTTTLDAHINTLLAKKNQLRTDKAAFISKLTESKQFACGASQGQFKTTMEAARGLHKKVMADRKDIKQFVEGTLKPTLQGLKSFRKPTATSTTN